MKHPSARKALPYGVGAVLIECPGEAPHEVAAALRRVAGVREAVPAAETVLVEMVDGVRPEEMVPALMSARATPGTESTGRGTVVLPVRFDGPDLEDVAALCRCDPDSLVQLVTDTLLTAAFCGFAPGFAYLTGLPDELHVPRLDSPRTRVPAGSVAIAGGYAAIYPQSSPGGWRIIGQLSVPDPGQLLFDPTRVLDGSPDPVLLTPGTRVQFTRSST